MTPTPFDLENLIDSRLQPHLNLHEIITRFLKLTLISIQLSLVSLIYITCKTAFLFGVC